jgi:osmoprotectant transport system substrate-binding protein
LLSVTLASLVLVAAACGDDDDESTATEPETSEPAGTEPAGTEAPTDTTAGGGEGDGATVPDGPAIVIGAQDFGESAILAEIYGQALEDAGYPVEQQALGGFRDLVFTAFESGDINFTPEYAASALEFLNGDETEASGDIEPTVEALRARLAELGLQALEPAPAVDSNSFVVTAETAEELGLSAVSDLTEDLTLGGPPDCPENAFCIPGLIETYGIDLSANFVPLDGGGPLTVEALDGGEIDVAILFSTNGVIADRGWVVLEDDMGLINADNIVPIVTDEVASAYGDDMVALVNAVSAALSTEELTELNRQFDIDKLDADAVARAWLESEGLIGS